MTRVFMVSLAAAATFTAVAAPAAASASCADRKATGTVVGGIGGALIGNSIARGGGGAFLGGLGGAVAGHSIAASGCRRYYRSGYYRPVYRRYYRDERREYAYRAPSPSPTGYGGGASGACPLVNRSYYDDRGNLISQEVPSCGR